MSWHANGAGPGGRGAGAIRVGGPGGLPALVLRVRPSIRSWNPFSARVLRSGRVDTDSPEAGSNRGDTQRSCAQADHLSMGSRIEREMRLSCSQLLRSRRGRRATLRNTIAGSRVCTLSTSGVDDPFPLGIGARPKPSGRKPQILRRRSPRGIASSIGPGGDGIEHRGHVLTSEGAAPADRRRLARPPGVTRRSHQSHRECQLPARVQGLLGPVGRRWRTSGTRLVSRTQARRSVCTASTIIRASAKRPTRSSWSSGSW